MAADYAKNMDGGQPYYQAFQSMPGPAMADINKATTHFTAQQSGLIEMQDYVEIS